MFMHKVKEGGYSHLGFNWRINENSIICFSLVIPIWIILPAFYYDFDTDNFYIGWRRKDIRFYFRLRRWQNFSPGIKKVIYAINVWTRPFGKRKLIFTREFLEDLKDKGLNFTFIDNLLKDKNIGLNGFVKIIKNKDSKLPCQTI